MTDFIIASAIFYAILLLILWGVQGGRMTTTVCTACDKPCEVITVDHGGYEEIWGARRWHEQLVDVSECCEEDAEQVPEESMGLEDEFKFGKHKGHQLEDVIEDDPDYIRWCVENDIVDFDNEAQELIEKRRIV